MNKADGTPEATYSRLFSDLEIEAMEIGGPGEEETVKVDVATEKEEYDKELEERLGWNSSFR